MPLTPADVHNVAFSKPYREEGYNEDEVDAFLDLVEAELARLIEENDDLREQVSQLEQRLGNAQADLDEARSRPQAAMAPPAATQQMQRPVEPPPMPQRQMEHRAGWPGPSRLPRRHGWRPPRAGREGPRARPGDGRPAHGRGQERGRRDARGRAQQVRAAAVGRPRQVGRPGQRRAVACETMLNDARTRAETLERQSRDKAAQLVGDAERKQTEIIGSITRQVRAGEEDRPAPDVRARVPHSAEELLESQLRDLEGRGTAAPADAGRGQRRYAATGYGQRADAGS